MHGDAEQEVVSHPFPPALPLVCAASVCPSISVSAQIVQSGSLHSFKRFSFWPGISHSLGFDPVTDVPPARASRYRSACHQLEKALVRIMYLRCTLRQISVMRCVPAAQREAAILNLADENGMMKRCDWIAEIQEDCRRLANVETGE